MTDNHEKILEIDTEMTQMLKLVDNIFKDLKKRMNMSKQIRNLKREMKTMKKAKRNF